MVSSCSQEEIVQQQTVSLSDCKFIASFEQTESRTYLEDGKYLRWTANDELSIFMGKTLNRQFRFTGETGDNSGGFEEASSPGFVTGNDLDNPCHYAIYPYAKGTKITETGVLTVNLPSEQTYEENSFGCGANTMVAVTSSLSDMELSFKNACGYLKFKLYGDDVTVKSVTLQSNGEEKLSGSATLIAANDKNPSITMSSTASDMITLDCGTGVKIGSTSETATEFWFVVPPTTFESGFTVTIKDVNDNEFTKSTSKEFSIERNVIKPISAFEVELVETIPNNQIWYTSSDGNVITPKTGVFSANITSNIYENGKGIITFDKELTTIGENAFYLSTTLTSIIIPNGVITIENSAFDSCYSLTDVTMPNRLTTICDDAFKLCSSLANITIPNNVTLIGEFAFSNCTGLASFIIPNSVAEIGAYAFNNCSSLSDIIIPESVRFIGDCAFSSCPYLLIKVDDNNTIYDSRDNCNAIIETNSNTLIQGCNNTVIPNDITIIGDNAFAYSDIENITIPDGVTTIGGAAFFNCYSLKNIVIPNSVNAIKGSAFYNCNSLNSITIPQGVTTIESSTFSNCTSLRSISIPNTVTKIGEWAFSHSALSNITIPHSVVEIEKGAFSGVGSFFSPSLQIHIQSINPPKIYASDTFDQDAQIYIPAGSLEAYKAADYWKNLNLIAE